MEQTREMRTTYKILVEYSEEKKLLERMWHTWVNNIVACCRSI
jgi:ribulose bisphosphate carboxylase small subunit